MRILIGLLLTTAISQAQAQAQNIVAPHHRFDMTQNGQKMSAQDFEQWMAQRGLKIVGRKNAPSLYPTALQNQSPVHIVIPSHNKTPVVDEKIRAAGPGSIVGF